ncbi:hypothetical protein B0O99DRAFT_638070 [Bisporella sp. PMI_857]|nr:hypothetical protein B0O99DRAFT_638070 [Bisporella sp. PMI_857]
MGQAAGFDNMPAAQQRIDQLPHHSKPSEMIDSPWDESSRYSQHDNPASSYQPSSPRIFLLPENLFFNVDLYMEQLCWRAAFIKTGNRDYRFNIPDSETKATTLEKFVGYTKQALQFAAKDMLVEARKVLSMACGLIRTLLEDENPIAYMNLVNTMLEYWDEPSEFLHQFNDLFRAYISRMAAIVLPYGHPWRTIWVVIGAVNTDQVREILLVSLDCMVNTLKRNIGSYQGIAVNGRLLHTKWKYSRDLPAAETALRSLIPESADPSNGTYKSYFKAMFHLARNLRLQGKYNEGIIIAKQHLAHARVYGDIDDLVNALNLNANMYHHMGEKAIAEAHIREAADTMLAKLEATSATWGVYLLGILEDWVRKDGRIQEADDIKAEMADLMERDKIRDDTEEE